jgi:hypothetical protein
MSQLIQRINDTWTFEGFSQAYKDGFEDGYNHRGYNNPYDILSDESDEYHNGYEDGLDRYQDEEEIEVE